MLALYLISQTSLNYFCFVWGEQRPTVSSKSDPVLLFFDITTTTTSLGRLTIAIVNLNLVYFCSFILVSFKCRHTMWIWKEMGTVILELFDGEVVRCLVLYQSQLKYENN